MENIKVKVKNEAESKEVQELFFELGAILGNGDKHPVLVPSIIGLAVVDGLINFIFNDVVFFDIRQCKELTIPQLRDMVVLKRNDVNDATHYSRGNMKWFVSSENKIYSYASKQWNFISNDVSDLNYLKPIEKKEMKEFLVNHDGKWTLQLLDADTEENSFRVAVPSGADALKVFNDESGFCFYKENYTKIWQDLVEKPYWGDIGENSSVKNIGEILWQRSEEFTKVAIDELKHRVGVDATLADRQATYGSFEDVAFVTESVMSVLSRARPNGLSDLPHTHRMALYMIASKMARLVNGDFNHLDGWHDIGGYAKLIEDMIKKEMKNED